MKILHEKPPCYDRLKQCFEWIDDAWDNGLYITYGSTLYTVHTHIEGHIMAHEEVHARQQEKMDKDEFVERYISDKKFRIEIEIEAYRAQVKWIKEHLSSSDRKSLYRHIVYSLVTFYGLEMTSEQTRKLLYI